MSINKLKGFDMEERVKKLLEKHKDDKDLTSEKDYIKPGWDWSEADLSGWNLEGLFLSDLKNKAIFFNVNFQETNLKNVLMDGANLRKANFYKADLRQIGLYKADLQLVTLSCANLENVSISEANLKDAFLSGTNLKKAHLFDVNLKNAELWDSNFQEADLWGVNFSGAILVGVNFKDADFDERTYLHNVNFSDCKLDNSTLKNAYLNLDRIIIQEKENNYYEARRIYLSLKNYFKKEGMYNISGEYYYREKLMENKCNLEDKKYFEWIFNSFFNLIAGYGERCLRVIIGWFIIIFGYAFIYYYFSGIYDGMAYKITSYNAKFLEAIYFSIVTFTTLGFGDLAPKPGLFQLITSSEALVGAIFMALFIFVFARKMSR